MSEEEERQEIEHIFLRCYSRDNASISKQRPNPNLKFRKLNTLNNNRSGGCEKWKLYGKWNMFI